MRVKVISSVCAAVLLAPAVPAQENNAERPATTRAADGERVREARMRAFLRSHPHLFRAMRKEADKDGDGKLDKQEREEFVARVKARMAEQKERRQEPRAERRERIEEFQDRHPRAAERVDRNGDGEIGPREAHRARKVHDWADRNDDGKVGPLERARARKVKDHVDRNDDGKVGPAERARARKVKDRVDRNDDGKVGPVERRKARRAVRRSNGR